MGSKSNFDRLHEAGVIAGEQFSDSDKQLIDKMSDEEVDVLIKLRHKMGEAPAGKEHLRPNIGI
ncbi:MAG TPA: aroma-sacti cluster domain-containing protein [Silvibacterium sp.]|nr:aroma-sacti cluster domain-containing protein [Silvibacterium sp.]